jgi:hypothetical protein
MMTDSLHSEVLAPTHSHLKGLVVVALGVTSGAIAAAFSLAAIAPSPTVRVIEAPPEPESQVIPVELVVTEPAQPMRSSDLALVFSAGGATYMKLADIGGEAERMPKHGKPRLVSDDYVESAIAAVQPADLPPAYRSWRDREVKVDNTCTTHVTGFAVVARLTGDTGYAGVDESAWTAHSVLEHGSVVLAAKLADCKGTYARDAALPAVIVPERIENARLVKQARAQLIESAPARETQREWLAAGQQENWYDAELAELSSQVLRHPTTGVTWISVHAHMEHGCGDPEVNVWGLFRVQDDGTLAAVQLRKLGDLDSIDHLVDIDNDGELELIGKPWLGLDTVIVRASGEELDRLPLSFFGCAC